MTIRRPAVLLLLIAALAPASVLAAPAYAGITKVVAVARARAAEYRALKFGVSIGTITASQATSLRHQVAAETPRVSKGHCNGKQAWRVVWAKSTPIMVGKGVGPLPATLCRL